MTLLSLCCCKQAPVDARALVAKVEQLGADGGGEGPLAFLGGCADCGTVALVGMSSAMSATIPMKAPSETQ